MHDRYARQRALPQIGADGHHRIAAAHAVIIGVGALGCVCADHLARAGIARLTLIDRDIVDHTNLHRQPLFTEADADAGLPKVEAASARLRAVNSALAIEPRVADLTGPRAEALVLSESTPTIIIDGTDNFDTRYILNDIAVKHGIPLIYAGVVGTRCTVAALIPTRTPCLRCIAPVPPPAGSIESCDTAGVLGPAVGAVASLQAALALRAIAAPHDPHPGVMLEIDAWTLAVRSIDLAPLRDPRCPCCGRREFPFLAPGASPPATVLCGRSTVQITPPAPATLDLPALAARIAPTLHSRVSTLALRIPLPAERADAAHDTVVLTVFPDGRALVSGITSPERARSIYARYIGL